MRNANSVAQSAKFSTAPCKFPVVVFTSRYDEVTQIITDELFIFLLFFPIPALKKEALYGTVSEYLWGI